MRALYRGARSGRAAAHRSQLRLVGRDLASRSGVALADELGRRRLSRGSGRGPRGHGRGATRRCSPRASNAPGEQRGGHLLRRYAAGRRRSTPCRSSCAIRTTGAACARFSSWHALPGVRPRPVDALEQPSRRLADGHGARRRRHAAPDLRVRHALPLAGRRRTRSWPAAGCRSWTAACASPTSPGLGVELDPDQPGPRPRALRDAAPTASATTRPRCASTSIRRGPAGCRDGERRLNRCPDPC